MGQSKKMSALESVFNVMVGFGIAFLTQLVVFPIFDIHAPFETHVMISTIFTVVSLVRSYVLRRIFNKLDVRKKEFMQIHSEEKAVALDKLASFLWNCETTQDHFRAQTAVDNLIRYAKGKQPHENDVSDLDIKVRTRILFDKLIKYIRG